MNQQTRARWMVRLWWLWLPVGAALIIYAVAHGSGLGNKGGPFVIGCFLVAWGLVGANLTFRAASRRRG